MGTTSITLTLIVVAIAIGATAWMVISRRGKSRERHHEPKEGQEPRQPEPTTADESFMQSEESHAPVAEDEATTPADKTSTVAATEPAPPLEGDVGLAITEDFTDQVQEGIPEASVESPDSSTEAKPLDPETHSNSESQQSALAQQSEEPPEQPVAEGEVTGASVEGAEEIGEPTEPALVKPAEKAAKKPRDKVKRAPEDSGGRPRVPTSATDNEQEQKRKPRTPKPEIVCWKREREWILAVEFPDDISEKPGITIIQDGKPLEEDESERGCWRLAHLRGEIIMRTSEDEDKSSFKIILSDDDYLVFKLSGGDLNQGRRVTRSCNGSCLAIVPATWERDEEKAGPAPATPEPVCLEGYRAHFFALANDTPSVIAFRNQAGASVTIGPKELRFQLVGERFVDASEDVGSLFGRSPPQIHATNADAWAEVGTIAVGVEGRGKGRWRMAFQPNPTDGKQMLPDEITARKAGWYFLRFYDTQDELTESFDFRFIAGLKEFSICQPSPFPPATGHAEATVEFLLDADCRVTPACPSARQAKIRDTGGKTVLTIPPLPACDRSRWLVRTTDAPESELTILIERVWWAVSEADQTPLQWQDAPVSLRREDFTATSVNVICLRFPKRRWSETVVAGFQRAKGRRYEVKVTETTVTIPIRDFADAEEVADKAQEHCLKIWMAHDIGFYESVIATIPADLPLEYSQGTFAIADISAPHLASALTAIRRGTTGPLRSLIKEVRREYRRPHSSATAHTEEFVKKALCVIAVAMRAAEDRQVVLPRISNGWISRSRRAAREFPEIMRQVWRRYGELQ